MPALGANAQATAGLADGTRIVVRAGGPTREELAALVLALDDAARRDRAAEQRPAPSPWRRAALIEGLGSRQVASPADMHRP